MRISKRLFDLETETAFEVLSKANKLQSEGKNIINLGIGQPDFPTPINIVEAGQKAIKDGYHGYTPSNGIVELREAVAEDIFNYRANLTNEAKKKIIPNENAFPYSVDYVYRSDVSNKKLKLICLTEMDKFVSKGLTKEDRYTGSLYMLTALTQVSTAAAESLYWLVQTP